MSSNIENLMLMHREYIEEEAGNRNVVERRVLGDNRWEVILNCSFNWAMFDYRLIPTPDEEQKELARRAKIEESKLLEARMLGEEEWSIWHGIIDWSVCAYRQLELVPGKKYIDINEQIIYIINDPNLKETYGLKENGDVIVIKNHCTYIKDIYEEDLF